MGNERITETLNDIIHREVISGMYNIIIMQAVLVKNFICSVYFFIYWVFSPVQECSVHIRPYPHTAEIWKTISFFLKVFFSLNLDD